MKLLSLLTLMFLSIQTMASFDIACWFEQNKYGPDLVFRINQLSSMIAIDSVKITEDDGDPLFLPINFITDRSVLVDKNEIPIMYEFKDLHLEFSQKLSPYQLPKRFQSRISYSEVTELMSCKVVAIESTELFDYDYVKSFKNERLYGVFKLVYPN